ncbi:MAG TPA: hypothetical protein VMO47_19085 [Rhodothermales bacterium]|nr:hypothetical protein [Rhodothermales bacterium]
MMRIESSQQGQQESAEPMMLSPIRAHRMGVDLRIIDVAANSNFSASRISILERFPSVAEPGELDRLQRAIDRIAASKWSGGNDAD